MFEAKLSEGAVLKKIVESIKDIVTDVNIDISPSGKYKDQSKKVSLMVLNWLVKEIISTLLSESGCFFSFWPEITLVDFPHKFSAFFESSIINILL